MGMILASCSDDYDDWSQPQQNPQEEAITIPAFTATAAPAIDFDQAPADSVDVFSLSSAALPEGFTLSDGRVELTLQGADNAQKLTVSTSAAGRAATGELLDAVISAAGKRPVARTFDAQVWLDAVKDGQAVLVNAGKISLTMTPKASTYTFKYYAVGAMQEWNPDTKSCLFYAQSQTVQSYTTRFDNAGNLKIWAEDNFGDWNNALGIDGGDSNAASGTLTVGGSGAIVCPEPGCFYTITVDFDHMTYTWTKLDDQTPTAYEKIAVIGGFNGWDTNTEEVMTEVTPHNWFVKLTITEATELKFRANGGWDINWGDDSGNVAAKYYGKGTNGAGNIKVPAGTYNVFLNDITGDYAFVAVE